MIAPAFPVGCVPTAAHCRAPVVESVQLARDTWRVRIASPELARQATPGQFFMLREPGRSDPLLGRPFALYDTYLDEAGQPAGIDVVYLVVGKMTRVMRAWQAGDTAEVWGPLGNGFPAPPAGRLVLVAGGIGQTPFLATAREATRQRNYGTTDRGTNRPTSVTFCYGARNAEYLAGLADFQSVGIEPRVATDDGSYGHKGFVTDLLREELARSTEPVTVHTCGPEPMLHAVAKICETAQVPCWVSLETPMACGFGACFSCVTKVAQEDGTWDYKRVCVEGPIFPARDLVWG